VADGREERNRRAHAGGLKLTAVNGSIGRSTVSDANTQFSYSGPFRIDSGTGNVTVALDELYPWLRSLDGLKKNARSRQVSDRDGPCRDRETVGRSRAGRQTPIRGNVEPHDVRVDVAGLPAPVALSGGSVRVTPSTLTLASVDASLLDLRTKASGGVFDYTSKRLKVDGSLGRYAWSQVCRLAVASATLA